MSMLSRVFMAYSHHRLLGKLMPIVASNDGGKMKVLALAIVMLIVAVPAYAESFNKETSTEIIVKGKVLASGVDGVNTQSY